MRIFSLTKQRVEIKLKQEFSLYDGVSFCHVCVSLHMPLVPPFVSHFMNTVTSYVIDIFPNLQIVYSLEKCSGRSLCQVMH